MKRLVLWGAGFVVLILVNVVVEAILLPMWDLEDTPRNDIYFIGWWIAVGAWLLFGNLVLMAFEKSDDTPRM